MVTLKNLSATDHVVWVVCAITIAGVDVLVTAIVDVVVLVLGVVTGDVEEGGCDEAAGARGMELAVSVKTRTINRRGLDHIKRWALFSEKGERVIVFEG